ncbi:MAG TPA: histidine ammonia-lyase, partial [Candidatus Cloacimonas sp.]|nr:histidine ammonia-lyase [Candidatus Cloacimonas sp.]
MQRIIIDGNSLTLEDVERVALQGAEIEISEAALQKVAACRAYVDKVIAEKRVVYGLTTGFGKFSTVTIEAKNIAELQLNLIRSHAVSVGDPYSEAQVRAIMLLRINVLAKGHAG